MADSVVIRTNGASGPVIQSVAKTLKDLAPTASVTDIRSMNSYVDDASARRRFQTAALTVFAIVAVFLMLVGLYGLLSFMVGHRRREIGIRMAVGASKSAIFRMTIRYGMKLTLTGLVVGTFLTLILTRVMTSFLYGVQAIDPQTLVFVPALVISLALVACVAPAYTAARIEPVRVLEQP